MEVTLNTNNCVVTRGDSPKIYSDSVLLHAVKKELIAQGHDVIKKRMWRDGHMVDDDQQYIRERSWKFAIYWGSHANYAAYTDYNSDQFTLKLLCADWRN